MAHTWHVPDTLDFHQSERQGIPSLSPQPKFTALFVGVIDVLEEVEKSAAYNLIEKAWGLVENDTTKTRHVLFLVSTYNSQGNLNLNHTPAQNI